MDQQHQAEANEYGSDRVVATIPWIPQLTSTGKMEQLPFFKQMRENTKEEEGSRRLYLYQLLNRIFPFYLPKRYHSMDCKGLQENSKNGQYWALASHFLLCNQAHGHIFYHAVVDELEMENADLSDFSAAFDHKELDSHLKEDGLEQCESAAEFLLEPWVLIQLPFQPVLMYQWAVALLAESYLFRMKICDLYIFENPKQLGGPLGKIVKMCSLMEKCAQSCMNFFNCYVLKAKLNVNKIIALFANEFFGFLPQVLPIIEFVTSDMCDKVIKALKLHNLKNRLYRNVGETERIIAQFRTFPTIYNRTFWRKPSDIDFLFHFKQGYFEAKDNFSPTAFSAPPKDMKISKAVKKELKHFVYEKIFKPCGMTAEEMAGKKLEKYLWAFQMYKEASEVSSNSVGPENSHNGYIYDLIRLYADLQIQLVLHSVYGPISPPLVHSDVHNGPVLSMSDVIKTLSKVKTDDKWRYQKILDRVKATCFSPSRTSSPDYKQGADKVAEHFQERIRNLVFKMIEKQYKTLKSQTFYYYPECQVSQYLLPCFVATFMVLDKDPSVSQMYKEKYLGFVHELIRSYEQVVFLQILTSDELIDFFSTEVHGEMIDRKIYDGVDKSSSCFLGYELVGGLRTFLPFNQKCLGNLTIYLNTIAGFACPWTSQMFMFTSRIETCFKKFGWSQDEPKETALLFMISLCFGVKILQDESKKIVNPLLNLLVYKLMELEGRCFDKLRCMDLLNDKDLDCGDLVSNIPQHFKDSANALTCYQVIGLTLFLYLKSLNKKETQASIKDLQQPVFPLDPLASAVWSLTTNDLWSLKQLISSMAERVDCEDPTLVSLQFAKGNLCYEFVLETLAPEGRVEMQVPGEITFCPIKHCRWCGLVDAAEFRVCPECKENPQYPDVNFFCSLECEEQLLEKQHTEEHCRFLVNKLEL